MLRDEHIENNMSEARDIADRVKDVRLKAEIMTAIAIVSNDPKDFTAINEMIAKIEGWGSLRSEAIVVVVRKLARARMFAQAREMIFVIPAKENYWRAEACARLARYSKNPSDFGQARRFVSLINTPDRRTDVLFEIERFEKESDSEVVEYTDKREAAIADLADILIRLGDASNNHAHQRTRASGDMAGVLA